MRSSISKLMKRLPPDCYHRVRRLGLRLLSAWPRSRLQTLSYKEIKSAVECLPTACIPRVIHQIWLGPERPPLGTMESCRQANPGWLYVLWTDRNLPPMFNRRAFDEFGTAYHGKADVLRYEVLCRFGGVYVDADQLCLRSFDDLVGPDDTFFAGYQNLGNPDLDEEQQGTTLVANAVLGASRRNPIIEQLIRHIGDSPVDTKSLAWLTVGPAALTKAIEATPSRAVVYPFHEFYPYHFLEEIPASPDDMVKAIHYRSHSVSLWGTTLGTYQKCRLLPGLKSGRTSSTREVPAEFAARHPRLAATVYHG